MRFVLDACALIAYVRNEPGAEEIEKLLLGHDTCMIHALNACEVYYDVLRTEGERVAASILADFEAVGVLTRQDMDPPFWQQAGRYKALLRRISLADAIAVALTSREKAMLITCDRKEFIPVQEQGLCSVQFIR
jgi:PIN domain nuclease of toxin-antitoxin system